MKLICAGNRYIHPDGAALWLYDQASTQPWPAPFEWIEGGLGGLNLLPHFEDTQAVLVIDYMPDRPNAELLTLAQVQPQQPAHYQHDTALVYLLHALPCLLNAPPDVQLMACNPDVSNWQDACLHRIRSLSAHAH